eukprot:3888321-Amphidinium_carterae.1
MAAVFEKIRSIAVASTFVGGSKGKPQSKASPSLQIPLFTKQRRLRRWKCVCVCGSSGSVQKFTSRPTTSVSAPIRELSFKIREAKTTIVVAPVEVLGILNRWVGRLVMQLLQLRPSTHWAFSVPALPAHSSLTLKPWKYHGAWTKNWPGGP